MEPVKGVEPLTCGLRNRCSATELHRLKQEENLQLQYSTKLTALQHLTDNRFQEKMKPGLKL